MQMPLWHVCKDFGHTTTQVMAHVITLGQQLIYCLHAPNKQPKGDQSENLFRALKSDYLEENKADLATNLSEELLQKKS